MSFAPPRLLQRVFPPMVTGWCRLFEYVFRVLSNCLILGTVVLMIGASLVGASGIPNWGGGSGDCRNAPTTGLFELCPTILAPRPLPCVKIHQHINLPNVLY